MLEPGTMVTVKQIVPGERVAGVADWSELDGGGFCWSGGLVAA